MTNEKGNLNLFAFYYPWYGTPSVSGYWRHWLDENHNPDRFVDGRRDIAATDYPLLDVYDCNNESVIKTQIDMAREANIDGFVVSWWGRYTFEDNALIHIKKACEQTGFKFTIYYENALSTNDTIDDIAYILNTYAKSNSWYRIDGRPVIYVYGRARDQLANPSQVHQYPFQTYWTISGSTASWRACDDVREASRYAIFVIHPYKDGTGFIQSKQIALPSNDTYYLNVSISDMRNDCPPNSDVGFRIKIQDERGQWKTLDDRIVNFDDGWLDLSYDVSSYAGQSVVLRVESYDGGVWKWASEWAAVDYLFISNSKGEILSQNPYFDNEWETVVETLHKRGYNPYFIMDFGGYEYKVESFSKYFLNFTDGIHTYNPNPESDISGIYHNASIAARSMSKTFVATITPGYNDTVINSPGFVADRRNGSFYNSSWSIAKSSLPDEYVITSFNEWHEGTEIEPSLEYGDLYINLIFSNTRELLSRDIGIEDVVPFRTIVGKGSTTIVNVTLVNLGDCLENFNLTMYANQTAIGTQKIENLAYGTGTAMQVLWNTTGSPLGNYVLRAEADQVENETVTSNNIFVFSNVTIAISGDIDADSRVNILDISLAARAYGSRNGEERYYSNADLNEDGTINILDISAIAKEYGKTV